MKRSLLGNRPALITLFTLFLPRAAAALLDYYFFGNRNSKQEGRDRHIEIACKINTFWKHVSPIPLEDKRVIQHAARMLLT